MQLQLTQKIDNILKADQTVYRNLKPEFEIVLYDGEACHIAEVIIKTDKPKPQDIRIFLSTDKTNWSTPFKFSAQPEDTMK